MSKLAVGWFTFTCSEDSTILLTELLNANFDSWKTGIDFRYFKALKSHNSFQNLDVAFIEGAISSDTQAARLKEVRRNSKYLIAVGSCACTGQPSASRNTLNPREMNYKESWYLSHFNYSQAVKKVADFVKVDDSVNGCPMDPKVFVDILNKYLKIFNI